MTDRELDQALVERVQRGDKRAFDLLVIKYQQKIINLVRRFVGDLTEAQDVAQEAFIKAYRALPNFRGDSAFYTWLYRIAVNTAKNHLVSEDRRSTPGDIDVELAEQLESGDRLREHATPEDFLCEAELLSVVHRAIQDLPEDLRTAVTLRELEGLSYEEIAGVMGCPIGTVRSRISRAREAIDAKIKPLLET
ncbi:MAG: RNA polymerase sigma factor RpoE [Gammaproteobacteria bacterium]|nr:RNA polymerase sigma factor RpoE [Gammaproteobacteria bacterium]MBU1654134.1 RNA polymerase sigma factor RpoE [Gammaproteobacteria bacterium]MBU1960150.1 RNA polymerase sigma factor RpoE [Gammaproteobacteria bacterium]